MKKLAIIIATAITISILVSSCGSGQRCAAYGESYKFQKQQNY
ncbi:MAG: hypothetical protein R6T99_01810 [Bacteroidales bacterium]